MYALDFCLFAEIKCGPGFYVRSLVHDLGRGEIKCAFKKILQFNDLQYLITEHNLISQLV